MRSIWHDPVWSKVVAGVILSFVGAFVSVYLEPDSNKSNDQYNTHMQKLTSVSKSIKELSVFVEEQKTLLIESKNTLNSLEQEKEKLSPIIKADRETVRAILELHAVQQKENIWVERGISFTIGIISSLFASALFLAVKRKKV